MHMYWYHDPNSRQVLKSRPYVKVKGPINNDVTGNDNDTGNEWGQGVKVISSVLTKTTTIKTYNYGR